MKHEEIEFRETSKQKYELTKIRKQENIGDSNCIANNYSIDY